MKVAVIGASGFVGAVLAERLIGENGIEVMPCIHSSGSAGQIARLGIPLTSLDLLDRDAVVRALQGCTHVVNCSRGGDAVMIKGLRHLLDACRSAGVGRFVHLSSVAVYGDPPSPDSVNEDGRTEPERGGYGWVKLAQDRMVAEAAAAGLSSVVLCPPNISGVQSTFLNIIVDTLRSGQLGLLNQGSSPCNLVDVRNLAHAITLALKGGPGDGQRLFVTDDRPTTWREVIESLRPLSEPGTATPAIGRDELVRLSAQPPAPRISIGKSLLRLVSSDVREALRKDPLWAKVDAAVRGSVRVLGGAVEDRMRLAVEGPIPVTRTAHGATLNVRLCAQQLRSVVHDCERAKRLLEYRPLYTFEQSMAAYTRWYLATHGWDIPVAPLLRAL